MESKVLSSKSTLVRAPYFLIAVIFFVLIRVSGAAAIVQGGGAVKPTTPPAKTTKKPAPRKLSQQSPKKNIPVGENSASSPGNNADPKNLEVISPTATDSNGNAAKSSASKTAAANEVGVNPNVVEANDDFSLGPLKGKNGTVLIFISVQCPIDFSYADRIEKLATDYRTRGINVVGINSNATETTDDIKQFKRKFSFIIVKDNRNRIADQFGAKMTPEVFFLDANNKLAYHGRIDNHRDVSLVQANDLRDAIETMLAGRGVSKAETQPFGCSIKRVL